MEPTPSPSMLNRMFTELRRALIAGVLVLAPLGVTFWVFFALVGRASCRLGAAHYLRPWRWRHGSRMRLPFDRSHQRRASRSYILAARIVRVTFVLLSAVNPADLFAASSGTALRAGGGQPTEVHGDEHDADNHFHAY